jgi:decaprenylphospho-beta-D-ribofuranose 2-oxidase
MGFIKKKNIRSWAKEFSGEYFIYEPKTVQDVKKILQDKKNIIPSGRHRSYGDSAVNINIINSKNFNKIIFFDERIGVLRAQSGVTIENLLNFLIPKGWFLKVTPGTKYATLGGCIASDVHGKEHHKEGCFSESVKSLKIITNKNKSFILTKNKFPELFKATCGGMGLTGFIVEATIQCKKIKSSKIQFKKKLNKSLKEVFLCFENLKKFTYSVAWIDTVKKNKEFNSIFTIGEFFHDQKFSLQKKPKISILFNFKIINYLTIILFNRLYFFWNQLNTKSGIIDYDSFFYPLDKIKNWSKLYGNKGFVQYQFIVPKFLSKPAILEVLNYMNEKKFYSSLAVLKLHGAQNQNYLSFPMSGYSLAMDFPINKKTFYHLKELDKIIIKYQGKIYLTKDSRMDSILFNKTYPQYKEILKTKKKYNIFNFSSKQSERLGINEY